VSCTHATGASPRPSYRPSPPRWISPPNALSSTGELARRAKDAGRLRPDFVLDDLILVLMANNGIRAASPAARVAASVRFAALAIQSFHASPDASPLPPAARLTPVVLIP
jgi:hypothetical protein